MEKSKQLLAIPEEVLGFEVVKGVTVGGVNNAIKAINAFQSLVRSQLKLGHDYGKIPGTGDKLTLLKPGAEKIAKLIKCSDEYDFSEKTEDWDKPFFSYTVKCRLVSIVSGHLVSEGIGHCNSWESKYRYRWAGKQECEKVGLNPDEMIMKFRRGFGGKSYPVFRTDNDDIFSIVNTLMKMAKKRALVDAALSAGRLSDLFTQDLDEYDFDKNSPREEQAIEVVEPTDGDTLEDFQVVTKPKAKPEQKTVSKPTSKPKQEKEPEEDLDLRSDNQKKKNTEGNNEATVIKRTSIQRFATQLGWDVKKLDAVCIRNFKQNFYDLDVSKLDRLLKAITEKIEKEADVKSKK